MKKLNTKKFLSLLILFPIISFAQWTQLGNSINGEAQNDRCGYSVAMSADGSIVAMGSVFNSNGGANAGQVRVFGETNGTWTQIGANLNGETFGDQTGQSVSLSSDGTIVAIGEPVNNDLGIVTGQVRVFKNISNNWVQSGNDINGQSESAAAGTSVDLSADGLIVAVGAPNTNLTGTSLKGNVRIFDLQNNIWVQKGADIDGDGTIIKFGRNVSLSDDGNTVAIAQTGDPMNGDLGRVLVYQFTNNQWVQIGTTIMGTSGEFGNSISLSSDGTILAIGTYAGNEVKVFQLNNGQWIQNGNTILGENSGDAFGFSVSLTNDGSKIAVGARFNSADGLNRGKSYVFENNSGNWTMINNSISGAANSDGNGFSIAISQNGSRFASGSVLNDDNGSNSGQVRVFENPLLSVDNFNSLSISYYPNPTANFLNFTSSENIESISIYNVLGQEILSKKLNLNEFTINLSNQSKGTYFAKVNSNENVKILKLVKL